MMERFGGSGDHKKEVPSQEGGELSASQLADAMRAAHSGREPFETGKIDPEELRDALARALENPISL